MKTREELQFYAESLMAARIEELEITGTRAAELCGISQPVISEIVNHSSRVSAWTIFRYLARLGVDVDMEPKVEKRRLKVA